MPVAGGAVLTRGRVLVGVDAVDFAGVSRGGAITERSHPARVMTIAAAPMVSVTLLNMRLTIASVIQAFRVASVLRHDRTT